MTRETTDPETNTAPDSPSPSLFVSEGTFGSVSRAQWEDIATKAMRGGSLDSLVQTTVDGIELALAYPSRDLGSDGGSNGPNLGAATAEALRNPFRETQPDWSLTTCTSHDEDAGVLLARREDAALLGADIRWYGSHRPLNTDECRALLETFRQQDDDLPGSDWIEIEAACSEAAAGVVAGDGTNDGSGHSAVLLVNLSREALLPGNAEPGRSGCVAHIQRGGIVVVSGLEFYEAGGSAGEELATAFALAITLLRDCEAAGLELETVAQQMVFRFATDQEFFEQITKLRAARVLWAEVQQACGLEPQPAMIQAVCGMRWLDRFEPWNNVLRESIAITAAAIAGADGIVSGLNRVADGTGGPIFKEDLGHSELTRLGINIQMLLKHESHLNRVFDPFGGSHYVEERTEALASAAWKRMQELEGVGVHESIQSGALARQLNEQAQRVILDVRCGRRCVVGVNAFARKSGVASTGQSREPSARSAPSKTTPHSLLTPVRFCQPHEQMREAFENAVTTRLGGVRPNAVFVHCQGDRGARKRLEWAQDRLEGIGLEVVTHIVSSDVSLLDSLITLTQATPGTVALLDLEAATLGNLNEHTAKLTELQKHSPVVCGVAFGKLDSNSIPSDMILFRPGEDIVRSFETLLGRICQGEQS